MGMSFIAPMSPLHLFPLVMMTVAIPQRNSPRQREFDGHEFVELLPEDFTIDEYDTLLQEFQSFLLRQELISRGDFVDVDNLECTPKIGKYTVEDPVQCDKYYICETDGKLVPKLCEDGLCTTSLESLATTHRGLSAKQGESCRSHRRPQAARGRTATSTRRSRRSATSTPPASTATRHLASAAPASFGARSSWLAPDPTSRRGPSVRPQSSTSSSAPTRGCGSATTTDFRIPPTVASSTSASRTRLSTRRPVTSRWPSTMQQGRANQRRRCRAAKTSTTKKMIERLESSVILNVF